MCLTWVHSFSGRVADLAGIGEVARANGSLFVVNASQGLGALPLRIGHEPVDALVSVGFKWLCGPNGAGLCWLSSPVRDQVGHLKHYWLSALTAEDLAAERLDLEQVKPSSRGRLDVFGTANFLNFVPWTTAIEFLIGLGISAVAAHDQRLVSRLLAGLDRCRFRLVSAEPEPERSTLVVIEPQREDAGAVFERLRRRGIDVAHRAGRVRLSPHLSNDEDDVDAALAAL